MQLLVLKLLYLLFRTEGMSEYFYTNDLCVLVDVFLREIGNIDEDNESVRPVILISCLAPNTLQLRHTYLRVLHPLLMKTQLRSMPYKRAQIVHTLESLIENESIRDIDPTTKRLVQRCLSGDWCVQFRKKADAPGRVTSPALSVTSATSIPQSIDALASSRHERSNSIRGKNKAASRSAENLLDMGMSRRTSDQKTPRGAHGHGFFENLRQPSADSTTSLPRIVTATTAGAPAKVRHRAGSMDTEATTAAFSTLTTRERNDSGSPTSAPAAQASMVIGVRPADPPSPRSPLDPPDSPVSVLSSSSSSTMNSKPHRRAAPPPPAKRRKPPAVPAGKAPASHTFSALGTSSSQPSLTSLMPRRP